MAPASGACQLGRRRGHIAKTLGDQIQIVTRLPGIGNVVVREQRATADPALDSIHPGDRIALSWDEAAPLLLGEITPADAGQQEES